MNYVKLRSLLGGIDWDLRYKDIGCSLSFIHNQLFSTMSATMQFKPCHTPVSSGWYTKHLRMNRKKVNYLKNSAVVDFLVIISYTLALDEIIVS